MRYNIRMKRSVRFITSVLLICLHAAPVSAQTKLGMDEVPSVLEILKTAKDTSQGINDEGVDKEDIARRIAEAQARAGDVKAASATVVSNPKYHSIILSRVCAAQAALGDLKAAYKTLDKIKEPADRVSAVVGIAKAYFKSGDQKKAASVFDDAIKEADDAPTKKEKTELLTSIARAQAQAGDWLAAYSTVDVVPDAAEKARLLAKMAKNEARAGNIKGAITIAEGITGNDMMKGLALSDIVSIRAKNGDTQGALAMARTITDPYYRGVALVSVTGPLLKQKKKSEATDHLQQAKLLARTMPGGRYDRSTLLREIAEAQVAAEDPAGARDTFQEAQQAAKEIEGKGTVEQQLALMAVAESLARSGNHRESEEVLQQTMNAALSGPGNEDEKTQVLTMIAESELATGESEKAMPILQRALEMSRGITDPASRAQAMIDISIGMGKADAMNEALDVLHQARQVNGQVTKELTQMAIYINISITLLRLGYMKDAIKVADESGSETRRADMLGHITRQQVEQGDVQDAYELAIEQSTPLAKTKALIGLAEGLLKTSGNKTAPEPSQ